jgi:hypothetical protein
MKPYARICICRKKINRITTRNQNQLAETTKTKHLLAQEIKIQDIRQDTGYRTTTIKKSDSIARERT